MSRRLLAAPVVALVLGAGACATSGTQPAASSASASSAPVSSFPASASSTADVCRAADDLRASIDALTQIDVVKQGTDALQQALTQVQADLTDLAEHARAQFGPQVQQVQSDVDALRSALEQVKANPSAETTRAVMSALRTLGKDTRTLLTSVGSSC